MAAVAAGSEGWWMERENGYDERREEKGKKKEKGNK